MRYSKQRELILETLKGLRSHPTAEEIYELVRKEDPDISLGTVYRNLNQLAVNDIVLRITAAGVSDRFDYPWTEHYHFRCTECGCVSDISPLYTPEIAELAAKIGARNLLAEGVCECCRKKIQ